MTDEKTVDEEKLSCQQTEKTLFLQSALRQQFPQASSDNFQAHYERLLQYERRSCWQCGEKSTWSDNDDHIAQEESEEMTQREDVLKFEQGRIRALQEERLHIQKKTFTKWMNSFLQKARMEVEDLFMDLADGKKLLKLLEIISGEKLGKANSGRMRVHKVENVNKSLAFLHTKVRLESIGAEDIVDGNPRLILGLIWTIILRFQIQEIEIDVDEENEHNSEKKSAKDALLLWCQRKTANYSNVAVNDFTSSWRSGWAFTALIHAHRPDVVEMNNLSMNDNLANLNYAFDVAHTRLAIPKLLDAEDVDTNRPDEKSIMTYVASYYHTFARMKNEMKSGRRIANIIGQMMEMDGNKMLYEKLTTHLLNWIRTKIKYLDDRNFANSLDAIQKQLLLFKQYRTVEKPPKYKERSEIEALYFHINTQLKSLNLSAFSPQEGQLIHDLESGWQQLERAEHSCELALREQLLRQERLEQLNYKFEKKSVLREGYLNEMIQVLSDPRYGSDLALVDATVKKHEALSADIFTREERFADLKNMSAELMSEGYHGSAIVEKRVSEVSGKWRLLLELVERHKRNLHSVSSVMSVMREVETVLSSIQQLQSTLNQAEHMTPQPLDGAELLLQQHSLLEMHTNAIADTVQRLRAQVVSTASLAASSSSASAAHNLLQQKLATLNEAYDKLVKSSKERRAELEEARNFSQFVQDDEEEQGWLVEKQHICRTGIFAKDLRAILSLQQKHQALMDEMKGRRGTKYEEFCKSGEQLLKQCADHPLCNDVRSRLRIFQRNWQVLIELADAKQKRLQDAVQAYQFYTDANEAESWLRERHTVVGSADCGEDASAAASLLRRHRALLRQLEDYHRQDVHSLNIQANQLLQLNQRNPDAISNGKMTDTMKEESENEQDEEGEDETDNAVVEEWVNEVQLVPREVWVDEPVEVIDYRTVMEERLVPQVKSLYPFSGQGMIMVKGEVMFLLNKTNDDWWSVRKANGQDGFVPANYVREIEPKVVQVAVRKPDKVISTNKVLKTKMVKQIVPVLKKIQRPTNKNDRRVHGKEDKKKRKIKEKGKDDVDEDITEESAEALVEKVEKRMRNINQMYDHTLRLAKKREVMLEDAIRSFSYFADCEDFERWMKEKERWLNTDDDLTADQIASSSASALATKQPVIRSKNMADENTKRKYEKFLTDFSASSKRIDELNTVVDEFAKKKENWRGEDADDEDYRRRWTQQLEKMKNKRKQLQHMWNQLNRIKTDKERNMEGASSVQLFYRTCDETKDWMEEKISQMELADLGTDLKTVQALQRRHEHLERELAPIEEKVQRVHLLAESVQQSFPSEAAAVQEREVIIEKVWTKVQQKAMEKRSRLEDAVGQRIFDNGAKNLLSWLSEVKERLNVDDKARDVATAEELLKKHRDLQEEVDTHQDEFSQLNQLGEQLLQRNGKLSEVKEKLVLLDAEREAVLRGCVEKSNWLSQCLDLQILNKEADHIDAATSSHQAFLEYNELGESVDEVETLTKRHDDFVNSLNAQDERLKLFARMADRLIQAGHYDSKGINERKEAVLARRKRVKEGAEKRGRRLLWWGRVQALGADVDELRAWMVDKLRAAHDDSFRRELASVERKLQKHEAFERELRANDRQLRAVTQAGERLLNEEVNCAEWHPQVSAMLEDVTARWEELVQVCGEKGRQLRQAAEKYNYYRTLDDAKAKLKELRESLSCTRVGTDLRHCKQLLNKHQVMEAEIGQWRQKVANLVDLAKQMEQEGHFDGAKILSDSQAIQEKFAALDEPLSLRYEALQEALRFHKFGFELETELCWIREHLPLVCTEQLPTNLYEAQSWHKKHLKFEAEIRGHQPMIDKTLASGQALIHQKHPETKQVSSLCTGLQDAWEDLGMKCGERGRRLEQSLKSQQFFFDANEIENWINEKSQPLLRSDDFGRDRDQASNLLTKHKALELELDTYTSIINEMGHLANGMVQSKHADWKLIAAKQQHIQQLMCNIRQMAALRRQNLVDTLYRHEYLNECSELEQWMEEQMQGATCEDYGHDYEHLLVLQKKLDDLKHRVECGAERFRQCDQMAEKLLSSANTNTSESHLQTIIERRQKLKEKWEELRRRVSEREQKVSAAGEIHRFHRDVAEACSRIHEKMSTLTATSDHLPARDLNAVLALIRNHEGFENDLLALQANLQLLVEDGARLQSLYPGNNAQHISNQQNMVVTKWTELQQISIQRREILQANCDLHRFLAQVRDISDWTMDAVAAMQRDWEVREGTGMAAAQMLKSEHEALKAEIETREQNFQAVLELGHALVHGGHYAANEIKEKVEQLLNERATLHAAWHRNKVHLDQLIDLHFFLRDAKQMDAFCAQHEAAFVAATHQAGERTVEEAAASLKKHQELEKVMTRSVEEKSSQLSEHGHKLVQQQHFESDLIQRTLQEVLSRCSRLAQLANRTHRKLCTMLERSQFTRDVAETEVWMEEKSKKLQKEMEMAWAQANGKAEHGSKLLMVNNLEEKVKMLQKHQAFEAELAAHRDKMEAIRKNGEALMKEEEQQERSKEIRSQLDRLLSLWNELQANSKNRGRGLDEAQDILHFNQQVDKIEAWIRDKEVMVLAAEMGRDYEHCLLLQRKLEDVDRVDESRISLVNELADKLVRQQQSQKPDMSVQAEHNSGHELNSSQLHSIQQRRFNLNNKWRTLQGALTEYKQHLAGALEIHAFNRDVDETLERLSEKAVILSSEDTGKDLAAVRILLRKHHALYTDIGAIEAKLKEHNAECKRLGQKYADMLPAISAKMAELQESWRELQSRSKLREETLSLAHNRHKLEADIKELQLWAEEMLHKMEADSSSSPSTVFEARAAIELHQERKAEIDGRREESFGALMEALGKVYGTSSTSPVDGGVGKKGEVLLSELEDIRRKVNGAWQTRKLRLEQTLQWLTLKQQADQLEHWLADHEAFLNNDHLGESLSAVEVLVKKHQMFEKTTLSQLDQRVEEVERAAREMVAGQEHYNSEGIEKLMEEIGTRKKKLKERCAARANRLQEWKELQTWLRDTGDVRSWLLEKQQVASDESYLEPSNLQTKIQKHASFEFELAANKGRLQAVIQQADQMLERQHFAANDINHQLDELRQYWAKLQHTSAFKRHRLQEAYQAMSFNRTLDDLEAWMEEVEGQLQSEDHGKDLSSVTNLLKRHSLLEQDVHSHGEMVDQLKETVLTFQHSNHFMKDEIQTRADQVIRRYSWLQKPMHIRRDNLEDALLLQQFSRDVEDEMQWCAHKEQLAKGGERASSVYAVHKLRKKHQALEGEVQSQEVVVEGLEKRAEEMISSGHFASSEIDRLRTRLCHEFTSLLQVLSQQKHMLDQELQSQTYLEEANEALIWLREKKPSLQSTFDSSALGKDQHCLQSHSKKLDSIRRELNAFQATIGNVSSQADTLLEADHFDHQRIASTRALVESEWEECKKLCSEGERSLERAIKVSSLLQEVDEVSDWLHDLTVVAASEDYGTDVEHVDLLIQAFDNFVSAFGGSEARVSNCLQNGRTLLDEMGLEKGKDCEEIAMKLEEMKQLWDDLKELSHARQEALAGAKRVHVFDRNADETMVWIQEKQALLLASDHLHDNNLHTIQALLRKHEAFEADLNAVHEQVESVSNEASQLCSLFPDARQHIRVKHEQMLEAWQQLLSWNEQKKLKLNNTEQLQAYFDQYNELMSWINELLANMSCVQKLADEVSGAEAQLSRHDEHKALISGRDDALQQFYSAGKALIQQGHFLSEDIEEKIKSLEERCELLKRTWSSRRRLYEQNLDVQIFKREAELLENWLESRERVLLGEEKQLGDSVEEVEQLIRKHDDLQKMIDAQQDKCEALKRITLLEEEWEKQKQLEVEKEKEELARQLAMAEKQRKIRAPTNDFLSLNQGVNGTKEHEPNAATTGKLQLNWPPGNRYPQEVTANGTSIPRNRSVIEKTSSHSFAFPHKKTGGLPGVGGEMKRAESMKTEKGSSVLSLGTGVRRTPSFTTRRRTQSFRKARKLDHQLEQLPPVELSAFLERKHELQSAGKKAPVRSWKSFYTVLCGQLLCFFKEEEDLVWSKAATSPITIYKARCFQATNYTKRKHVFRLCCDDGSEFLFSAQNEKQMEDWINKIQFHAQLPPSLQLLSYDESRSSVSSNLIQESSGCEPGTGNAIESSASVTLYSSSSVESTPEAQRRPRKQLPPPPNHPPPPPPPSVHSSATTPSPPPPLPSSSTQPQQHQMSSRQFQQVRRSSAMAAICATDGLTDMQLHTSNYNHNNRNSIHNHHTLPTSSTTAASPIYQNVNAMVSNERQAHLSSGAAVTPSAVTMSGESSSESELHFATGGGGKEKRSSGPGVLSSFFRKKKHPSTSS